MNAHRGSLGMPIWPMMMLSALVPSVASAQLSHALTPDSDEYEGYHYVQYEFFVGGNRPLVLAMESPSFDSYIVLLEPNGDILTNDDHGDLGSIEPSRDVDAGIRIDEPRPGRWLLLATSLSFDSTGPFTILAQGAADLASVTEANPDHLKDMFAARDVVSAEEEQERRTVELVEQLSLATFRTSLRSRLLSELHETEQVMRSSRTRLVELEEEERALDDAVGDLRLLPESSHRIVQPLLDQRRESAAGAAESLTSTLIRTTTDRAAFRQALQELEELQAVAEEIDRLHEGLMREGDIDELQKLRDSTREARARFQELAETIARKLLDSGFVDQLRFGGFNIFSRVSAARAAQYRAMAAAADMPLASLAEPASLSEAPSGELDPSVWLPQLLPWPPPDASARLVLRPGLLRHPAGGPPATLGEMADSLQDALREAGYDGGGFLGVPTGFAIVTRLEQTDHLGKPLDGNRRWITAIVALRRFSLTEYIRVLLTAPAGHFRVLAFIVASEDFGSSGSKDKLEAIETWSRTSIGSLPEQVRAHKLHDGYEVTVLVYEFLKRQEADRPQTTVPGLVTARDHLLRTGLDGLAGEG